MAAVFYRRQSSRDRSYRRQSSWEPIAASSYKRRASTKVTPPPDVVDNEPEPSAPPIELLDKVAAYEYASFDKGLFWRIHQMDIVQSAALFGVVTLVSTWLVAFAYKNVKFVLKHKVAVKREEAVTREIMKKLADDKKMSKKEKDERILWKKNEVADYEATTFSIFYNNALYLMLITVASFYVMRSFAPSVNYVLSVGAAGGLLALFSTSSQ